MDCGPACLKIISRFYARYYSLQFLRECCGKNREGVSFLDLSYAAEQIGFRAIALRVPLEDLLYKIPLPCIIHWKQSHFVVVFKVKNDKIYISDPAKGRISYDLQTFKEKWLAVEKTYGKVLVLEPQADFKQRNLKPKHDKKPPKTFEQLWGYIQPYKKSLRSLLLIMLLITTLQATLPFISKSVIDVGIQSHDISLLTSS